MTENTSETLEEKKARLKAELAALEAEEKQKVVSLIGGISASY